MSIATAIPGSHAWTSPTSQVNGESPGAIAETKTEANRKRQELVRSIEERGEKAIDGDKLTFKALTDKYKEAKLIPAEYVNQRKIAGVRSLSSALFAVRVLVEHFGDRRVRAITHSDIEAFKLARLKNSDCTRNGENHHLGQPRA